MFNNLDAPAYIYIHLRVARAFINNIVLSPLSIHILTIRWPPPATKPPPIPRTILSSPSATTVAYNLNTRPAGLDPFPSYRHP